MKKIVFSFILCFPLLFNAGEPKIQICASCHGNQGSSSTVEWPNIGGQHAKYLAKQLQDMKTGAQRNSPIMKTLLAALNKQDIDDLAAYYAKMPAIQGSTPPKYLPRGQQLYRGGDFAKHITACIACHGPKGTGNAEAGFPLIAGQHAAYTMIQLQAFKEGKRTNDLNHIMRDISSRMNQEDMEAVAHYIEGLY